MRMQRLQPEQAACVAARDRSEAGSIKPIDRSEMAAQTRERAACASRDQQACQAAAQMRRAAQIRRVGRRVQGVDAGWRKRRDLLGYVSGGFQNDGRRDGHARGGSRSRFLSILMKTFCVRSG